MSTSRKLIDALNQYSNKKFWVDPPDNPTFKNVLDQLAKQEPNVRDALNAIFWVQIKEIGTPIIEDFSAEEVKVHFLFPRNKFDYQTKKLYISGDFHGITSTNNARQEMDHLKDTDIMYRSDVMPKDSVVTYKFLQVPPEYENKNRPDICGQSEALPKSFYELEPIPEVVSDGAKNFKLINDDNAKHKDFYFVGSIFCANVVNDISQLTLVKNTRLSKLFNSGKESPRYLKNIAHSGTYLCDRNNDLKENKNVDEYFINNLRTDAVHTRSVSVFQADGDNINNLIIHHDGNGYIATGAIERINELIGEEKIPKNATIICITQLPGLVEKYKKENPSKYKSGMDPRPIEFGSKVDDCVFRSKRTTISVCKRTVNPVTSEQQFRYMRTA